MIRIGIVILNYIAYQTTIDTVESFDQQGQEGFDVRFVIVDNASPNESFEVLKKKYCERSDIHVVRTNKNIGFAKGNNFGCKVLFKQIQPDFVIVSNDDILLPQKGLYNWIEECYKKYDFAVLGPDVYSIKGKFHQSPSENYTRDKRACKRNLRKIQTQYVKSVLKKVLRHAETTTYPVWENNLYDQVYKDKTLHGSFQIFSEIYFKVYSEPYDPSTFLYMEEDILKLRCDDKKLLMIYDPSYQVHHLQAVSTHAANKDQYDIQIARFRNLMHSLKAYILKL